MTSRMTTVRRTIWDGAIEFEEDDAPHHVQLFNKLGKAPVSWHFMSGSLHASAVKLMTETRCATSSQGPLQTYLPAAVMLGAYAIETLLKTVIVHEYCWKNGLNYDALKTKEFLPTIHDLVELSKRATLRTNKRDRAILKALSEYSIWAGRYPTPRSANDFLTLAGPGNPNLQETWQQYLLLYEKLDSLARRKMRARDRTSLTNE